ncbi:MAG: AAA family ATPase [Candidatus Thorarchaeota archaeon]|nr:AAA family ATPase [Candidatus Thorarchaeota archaeon]
MINKIRLRDFKVFSDQELSFGEGITSIVGPNGTGKTTVLEAIEFALFKQVRRKDKQVRRVEDFIRHGQNNANVDLWFTAPVNGREYKVSRSIHKGQTSADLYQAGDKSPLVSGPEKVDAEIVKLLGVNRDAFSALTYVRQGEIDQLSRKTPKERKEYLFDMMGLGMYTAVAGRVQKRAAEIAKEVKGLEESKQKLLELRGHFPAQDDVLAAVQAVKRLEGSLGSSPDIDVISRVLEAVESALVRISTDIDSLDLSKSQDTLKKRSELAKRLRQIVEAIPQVAEEQLRPLVREEAKAIFLNIFGDRYSDLVLDDDYKVSLYNVQGHPVPLVAASGGEDVCVNFALRVGVNTALQKYAASNQAFKGSALKLIILDEPGAGLDAQRRRWLPEAVRALESVRQVIVVTHMDELREAADTVISLTPQGKGRQPAVEVQH